MHEFSIAMNVVSAACEEAGRAGAVRVNVVRCRIGELRQIDPQLMRQAFAAAGERTLCAAADLQIESVPMRAWCGACGEPFPVRAWEWTCPRCGGEGDSLGGGDELELCSIDVETDDEHSNRPQAASAK